MVDKIFEDFYNTIEPTLKKYEFLRAGLLTLVIFIELSLFFGILYLFTENILTFQRTQHCKILFMIVLFGCFIHWYIKKEFEIKIKEKILLNFIECFSDFEWDYWILGYSQIDEKILKSILILPQFNDNYSDDNFVGTYKGIPIKISEQTLKSGLGIYKTNVFDGIVIEYFFKNRQKFPTEIIIKDNGLFAPKGYEKVLLEDTEFNKMFNVYSNNQVECRFILTTGFMEKIKALKILFNAKNIALSFIGRRLFIAIDIGKDSFNIAKLYKRTNNKKLIEKMYNQFNFILKITDLLQFTNKI